MSYRRGDRVFVVGHCGTLGGDGATGQTFIDELIILDEGTARSQRAQAVVIIHGATLYRTREDALRAIRAESVRSIPPHIAALSM